MKSHTEIHVCAYPASLSRISGVLPNSQRKSLRTTGLELKEVRYMQKTKNASNLEFVTVFEILALNSRNKISPKKRERQKREGQQGVGENKKTATFECPILRSHFTLPN